jgi:ferredoxin--NADP+ reductase
VADTDPNTKFTQETVLRARQWQNPALVSVCVSKPPGFAFLPGQFARIGLPEVDGLGEPSLWRAYSMVSHPSEDYLEFLSVTVPDGQFSPRLAALKPGQALWVEKAPFGFLTLERFSAADTLWLVATGTGLSAYLPMLDDPGTWDQFKTVILVHGVRHADDLTYRQNIEAHRSKGRALIYLPVLSQEPWGPNGQETPSRITEAYQSGDLERVSGFRLDPEKARIMLCGNPAMVTDLRAMLTERGFAAGRRGNLGTLAVENYW